MYLTDRGCTVCLFFKRYLFSSPLLVMREGSSTSRRRWQNLDKFLEHMSCCNVHEAGSMRNDRFRPQVQKLRTLKRSIEIHTLIRRYVKKIRERQFTKGFIKVLAMRPPAPLVWKFGSDKNDSSLSLKLTGVSSRMIRFVTHIACCL
jgi:hypothetical protein